MAAAEVQLELWQEGVWHVGDVIRLDEVLGGALAGKGLRETRSYRDHFEQEAAMLAEAEPRPCRICRRKEHMEVERRLVQLGSGRREKHIQWWHCTACDSASGLAWGYPAIGDFHALRRYYDMNTQPRREPGEEG